MKRVIVAVVAIVALATSCKKDQAKGVYKGPVVKVNNGKAWTWVQLKDDGAPERIAVAIDDAAMNSVPLQPGEGDPHEDMALNSYVLALHPKASATPFKHIWLNWNPAGHEPPGIYDLPHFDVHFYSITNAEREAMANDKLDVLPANEYVPATYIAPVPGVPLMGNHWIDATSPELNGQTFTETFLYGSYNGKMIFYEPMITKAFLQSTSNYERDIPQPAKFQQDGYYPTKMRIVKHDGITEVIMEGFVYRQAS
mgnify:CR=1 FL=1|jgi:hypothetical protein